MSINGRQVARKKRVRGTDLPVGITDTLQISRQGKEQHLITVQVCFDNIRLARSYSYGHSRTRKEAVVAAKEKLAAFFSETNLFTGDCAG